jgi:hypothetical protein
MARLNKRDLLELGSAFFANTVTTAAHRAKVNCNNALKRCERPKHARSENQLPVFLAIAS